MVSSSGALPHRARVVPLLSSEESNPPFDLPLLYKKGPVPCALVVFRAWDSRTVMTFLKSPSGFHEVGRVEAIGSAGLTM